MTEARFIPGACLTASEDERRDRSLCTSNNSSGCMPVAVVLIELGWFVRYLDAPLSLSASDGGGYLSWISTWYVYQVISSLIARSNTSSL